MRLTGLGFCFGVLLFVLLLAEVAGADAAPSRISIASASPHTYSFRSQGDGDWWGAYLTIHTNQPYRLKNGMPEGLTFWRLTMACVKEKLTPQAEDDGTTSYHVDPAGFTTVTVSGTSARNLIANHTYQIPGKGAWRVSSQFYPLRGKQHWNGGFETRRCGNSDTPVFSASLGGDLRKGPTVRATINANGYIYHY